MWEVEYDPYKLATAIHHLRSSAWFDEFARAVEQLARGESLLSSGRGPAGGSDSERGNVRVSHSHPIRHVHSGADPERFDLLSNHHSHSSDWSDE